MAEISDRLLIISPHYDDGVFSCGALLAAHGDAAVATVFTGVPAVPHGLTAWDRDCGFASSHQAMQAREREDDAALERLGAEALRLGFFDDQYVQSGVGAAPEPVALASAIEGAIDALRAASVVMPLGLFHSDHHRVHDACIRVFARRPELHWLAYEDALYRRMPGKVQARIAALLAAGVCATPAFPATIPAASSVGNGALQGGIDSGMLAKREAVAAYESQLRAFGPGGYGDAGQTEHYWHLHECHADEVAP